MDWINHPSNSSIMRYQYVTRENIRFIIAFGFEFGRLFPIIVYMPFGSMILNTDGYKFSSHWKFTVRGLLLPEWFR
jgi:hypothetical protein